MVHKIKEIIQWITNAKQGIYINSNLKINHTYNESRVDDIEDLLRCRLRSDGVCESYLKHGIRCQNLKGIQILNKFQINCIGTENGLKKVRLLNIEGYEYELTITDKNKELYILLNGGNRLLCSNGYNYEYNYSVIRYGTNDDEEIIINKAVLNNG